MISPRLILVNGGRRAVERLCLETARPAPAQAELIVSADVNPDASGRASPVVVPATSCATTVNTTAADFFSVYEKEKETLG